MEYKVFDDMFGMPNVNGLEEKGIEWAFVPNNPEEKVDTWSDDQGNSKGLVLTEWEELVAWDPVITGVPGSHKVDKYGVPWTPLTIVDEGVRGNFDDSKLVLIVKIL